MRDDMKRRATPKDDLINEIVEVEWEMFDKVNNAGGRAACQDDEWTFYAMIQSVFGFYCGNADKLQKGSASGWRRRPESIDGEIRLHDGIYGPCLF